jgi:diphthamide synthase (EF-2-diphthine--ammonia ligase)
MAKGSERLCMKGPKEKAILSRSGGMDSALALYKMQEARDCEIVALLTTITEGYDRSSMHGIRRRLIEQQACSIGRKAYEETRLISLP